MMELLTAAISEYEVYDWHIVLDYWAFLASLAFLGLEAVRLLLKKLMTRNILGDGIANFVVFYAFIFIYYVALGSAYVAVYYFFFDHFRVMTIPTNVWSIALCVLLADFAYYWEHRFTHRTGIGWSTHTVHHSSPYMNISVAYRFGPLDGIFPVIFSIPLAIAGFNPLVIFFAEALVQQYQTPLHTELIGKLPKPIEAIFNTPSHHRVHHGSNPQYLDKNYGGILIIWDKIFGTFAEEKEKVTYGIRTPIHSVNPFIVFFHGLSRLARKIRSANSFSDLFGCLFKPPCLASGRKKNPSAGCSAKPCVNRKNKMICFAAADEIERY